MNINKYIILIATFLTIIALSSTIKMEDIYSLFPNINKIYPDNILGTFADIFNNYKQFLKTLNSEQLACLTNALALFTILMVLISITSTLFGDYILNILNLESKFPKLARYIKYRKTINKYYLIFNFIFLYLWVIFYLLVNIVMFFL